MPLLGLVADQSGPRDVFVVLALIPLIAVAISIAARARLRPWIAPARDRF
jgi:hypothetical protein